MTINVPPAIENAIQAAVQSGLFASADDAVAEAWQYFERQRLAPRSSQGQSAVDSDPILGSAGDHAELLDQIVEAAMLRREQRPLRLQAHE